MLVFDQRGISMPDRKMGRPTWRRTSPIVWKRWVVGEGDEDARFVVVARVRQSGLRESGGGLPGPSSVHENTSHGLEEIRRGQSMGNEEVPTRGWKLFLLLSLMLLF